MRGAISRRALALACATLLTAGTAGSAFAQPALSRMTVDGGGGRSSAGAFTLTGTIGQPDAGALSASPLTLGGGFWMGRSPSSVAVLPGDAAFRFRVFAARPNPLRAGTVLMFELGAPERVRAGLFDAAGRLVRVLVDERLPAGAHQRTWDRRDHGGRLVAPGVYFLRLDAGSQSRRQKLVVLS